MFRAIVLFGLITSAIASQTLDVLVNAAASFSATIQQQLEMLQSVPSKGNGEHASSSRFQKFEELLDERDRARREGPHLI
jgi:hypothetical protein